MKKRNQTDTKSRLPAENQDAGNSNEGYQIGQLSELVNIAPNWKMISVLLSTASIIACWAKINMQVP